MKKLIYIFIGIVLGISISVSAAPTVQFFKDIIPISNNAYNLGTSTAQWLNLAVQNASTTNLTATNLWVTTCTGCGGGGGFPGGTFNLNNLLGTTTFTGLLYAPSTSAINGTTTLDILTGGTNNTAFTNNQVITFNGNALVSSSTISTSLISGLGTFAPANIPTIGLVYSDGTNITSTTTLDVPQGGSGAGTLTGILFGNGAAPFTTTSTVAVTFGGSGATTLTGTLIGNGAAAFTATASPWYATAYINNLGATTTMNSSNICTAANGACGSASGVTSLNAQTGGLTFTGLLYGKDTSTLAGTSTLSIVNGGTNATSFTANNLVVSSATGAGLISSSTLDVLLGGTGVSTLTGFAFGNGAAPFTGSSTIALTSGGTGATTAATALTNLGFLTGTQGWLPYYGSASAILTPTSTIFISTANNVGIASTSPLSVLSVNVSNASGTLSGLNITSATSSLFYVRSDGNIGLASTSPKSVFSVNVSNAALNSAMNITSPTSSLLYVGTGGMVGIGTTQPVENLTIVSTGGVDNPAVSFMTDPAGSAWTVGLDTTDKWNFKIASSTVLGTNTRFTITGAGFVGIGTTTPKTDFVIGGKVGSSYPYIASSSIMLQTIDGKCHILSLKNGAGTLTNSQVSGLLIATATCP